MTDPRALVEAYGKRPDPFEPNFTRESAALLAFKALRAVLDLHNHETRDRAVGIERLVCVECSDPERGYWTMWPCETVLTITWALEDS